MPMAKQAAATWMSSKGRGPTISAMEQRSTERRGRVEERMTEVFRERSKDPFGYVMGRGGEEYYQQQRQDVYGEKGMGAATQQLTGALARTGQTPGVSTSLTLGNFAKNARRDRAQFDYIADRQDEQLRESALQSTVASGRAISGSPMLGTQQTDAANERIQQNNEWRARWLNVLQGFGMGTLG